MTSSRGTNPSKGRRRLIIVITGITLVGIIIIIIITTVGIIDMINTTTATTIAGWARGSPPANSTWRPRPRSSGAIDSSVTTCTPPPSEIRPDRV
jgi:hypothetical protein